MNPWPRMGTLVCLGLVGAMPLAAQAGYFGPGYAAPAPRYVELAPAPAVYTGASYGFYGPSFTPGSGYAPNYVAPFFNRQRYPNPGPYYYSPTFPFTPSYYSYYYTPGYFRY